MTFLDSLKSRKPNDVEGQVPALAYLEIRVQHLGFMFLESISSHHGMRLPRDVSVVEENFVKILRSAPGILFRRISFTICLRIAGGLEGCAT